LKVVPVHAGNPGPMTGAGNWTYLVPGARPLLVDAGVGHVSHLDALFAHAPAGPVSVIVTHAHPDHASGAPALHLRAPAARFLKIPWPACDVAIDVPWEALSDGMDIETDEGPLRVVHTPGHSPDHVILWHAASRTALTGDLLVAGSSVVIPASRGGVLADYLQSLETIGNIGRVWGRQNQRYPTLAAHPARRPQGGCPPWHGGCPPGTAQKPRQRNRQQVHHPEEAPRVGGGTGRRDRAQAVFDASRPATRRGRPGRRGDTA